MPDITALETPRLRMRPFRAEDFDDLHRLFSDPEVMRYITNGRPKTVAETEESLRRMIYHWQNLGYAMLALFERSTDRFLGRCGLQPLAGTPSVELGYTLLQEVWGQGYATEAAKECVRFGFEIREFPEIVAIANIDNKASRHVMEKCGLQYEKTEPYFEFENIVWYRLTCYDYLASKKLS